MVLDTALSGSELDTHFDRQRILTWVLALWECKRMILRWPEGRPGNVTEASYGATKNEGREITRAFLRVSLGTILL